MGPAYHLALIQSLGRNILLVGFVAFFECFVGDSYSLIRAIDFGERRFEVNENLMHINVIISTRLQYLMLCSQTGEFNSSFERGTENPNTSSLPVALILLREKETLATNKRLLQAKCYLSELSPPPRSGRKGNFQMKRMQGSETFRGRWG